MKAQVATIDLGFAQFDGLMLPNGEYAIAVPQIADLLEIPRGTASRDLNRMFAQNIEVIKVTTSFNQAPINAYTLENFYCVLLALYNSKNEKNLFDLTVGIGKFLGKDVKSLQVLHTHNKRKKPRSASKQDEKEIQTAYHARLGGQIEVQTPLGRIDLLTDDSLYEFKHYSSFKEAVGQVLCYQKYAKKAKSYIVLFGCPKGFKYRSEYSQMLEVCEDYGIRLRTLG